MNDNLNDNLFEIESWRNRWFYKFRGASIPAGGGGGAFGCRRDAIAAAAAELAPLAARYPSSNARHVGRSDVRVDVGSLRRHTHPRSLTSSPEPPPLQARVRTEKWLP